MPPIPCPVCGYDAPGAGCPHCAFAPREESLRASRRGLSGVHAGLIALPRGLYLLGTTRGVKRFLVPPFLLTLAAFGLLFRWFWGWIQRLQEAIPEGRVEDLPFGDTWLHDALAWVVRTGIAMWMAELTGVLLFLVVSSMAVLWAFSIVYEALAGPFLDEIQGRIERIWFGKDPRDELSRPTALAPSRCALLSSVAALPALAAVATWWVVDARWSWSVLVLGVPAPFLFAAWRNREYGKWLWWVVKLEGGTLWVSIKASLIAGVILLVFFPVKFIPVAGYLLFGAIAGFTTAITLLDIPFERRLWPLRTRLAFIFSNAGAMVAFGSVASLLFVIPLLGPVLMVPAASIGGLWLVCALDKDDLRPPDRRRSGPREPAPAPASTVEVEAPPPGG